MVWTNLEGRKDDGGCDDEDDDDDVHSSRQRGMERET